MGLGLYPEGSGIAATKYLLTQNYDLIITDRRTAQQLCTPIQAIRQFIQTHHLKNRVTYHLNGHKISDFKPKNTDLIVKNPAISPDSPFLKEAQKNKTPITSDTALFLERFPGTVIGITGTRGKSTTTQLIYEILAQSKKPVILGGNIAISPLKYLSKTTKKNIAVLELPAQQLSALSQTKKGPHIAVITNILPDHLNFYKNSRQYINEKKRIFTYQTADDFTIFNFDNPKTRALAAKKKSKPFWFSLKKLPAKHFGTYKAGEKFYFRDAKGEHPIMHIRDIRLPGSHNQANILAAICAAHLMHAPLSAIKKVLKTSSGLRFRLQKIKSKEGIIFFNDSTATTPDGTMAALSTLSKQYPKHSITLIAGGIAKVPDYRQLAQQIDQQTKHLILLPGTAGAKIKQLIPRNSAVVTTSTRNLAEAVRLAKNKTNKPGIILLSPAAASYNQFLNEFDRGQQFNQLIKQT